jgi:hypothetical protein
MALTEQEQWRLDRRIPIAVIIMAFVQTGGLIYWGSGVDHRLAAVEAKMNASTELGDKVTRLEVKSETQTALLERIDRRLERLETQRR